MRTRIVEIDIDSSSLRILKYKQYDHNNLLKVIVKENKQFVDLSNYTIRAFFEFPNGNTLQRNATLVDGEINILLESIVLQYCGKTSLEIVLSNGKEIVSTFTIYLDVEKSIDRNTPIEGDPMWDIIKDGLANVDGKVDKEEFDETLENYYTKAEVDKKIIDITTGGSINLDGFATKEDIPTKLSDLENDSNFLTSIPSEYITDKELEDRLKNIEVDANVDLSNYVTKNELNNKVDKIEGKGLSTNDYTNEDKSKLNSIEKNANNYIHPSTHDVDMIKGVSTVAKSGDYNDLINTPNIPNKVSQLENDSNFLTSIPNEYVTESELSSKNYVSESFVTNKIAEAQLGGESGTVDLSGYATKDDLNDKADNLFKSDMLTVSALGGISAGTDLNNLSMQEVLTKLLYPYVSPTVSSSIVYSPTGGIYEFGQTVTVTQIKATVTKKSENITSVDFYKNGSLENSIKTSVSNGGTFTYTFNNAISITTSISNSYFQAKVVDASGKAVSANTSALNFYYPYYYGVVGANEDINENLIKGLTKQVVAKGNKTYSFSPNYQRIIIAYPKSYGVLKSILDPNGFEQLSSFTRLEMSIVGLDKTSQNYYVYVNDASTNTNFKMTFQY